ncbi:MAG TPA: site-specific integrase [Terriglobales bacterium]|jgi:integrase|nr:site-specific integrase [Terriglobales bacterium]
MRARHQEGRVEERGSKIKRWYGHYYVYEQDESGVEVRKHIGVQLGDKAKLPKWAAEERLRKIIANQSKAQPKPNSLTLEWFARERFLPMKQPRWAASTRETNLYHLERHILPRLGSNALCELEKFHCQVFLNDLAGKGFSFTVVDHCRTLLKAILDEALDADLIGKNPARKLYNPETREEEKPVLQKSDSRLLLDSLPFRDRLIAMIAAFCAMRPGEIFGLRWSSWRGDHLHVEGTAWRGTLRPGKAKTKGSKAPVAVPDVLLPLLSEWRRQCQDTPDHALMFPTEKGTPIRPENWLRRRIKPVAASLEIAGRVNFQVLRRTFATNAQLHGTAKDVQTHLRHSDIATTLGVYTQPIDASVRKLVNAVADDVMTTVRPEPRVLTQRLQ